MTKYDMLDVEQLENQCDSMIDELKRANEQLENCSSTFENICDSMHGKGETYEQLKTQLGDYGFVARTIMGINYEQITECEYLKKRMGIETLDGEKITQYMDKNLELLELSKKELERHKEALKKDNFFVAIYRKYKIAEAEGNVVYYTDQYNIWKEKSDRYDEISKNTVNMFSDFDEVRAAISSAIKELEGRFVNGKYNMPDSYKISEGSSFFQTTTSDFREKIKSAVKNYTDKQSVCLKNEKFVTVIDEDGHKYYGGDQEWYEELGLIRGSAMREGGCGISSLTNAAIYLDETYEISKADYLKRADKIYKSNLGNIIRFGIVGKGGMIDYFPFSDTDIQSQYDKIVKEKGFNGAGWNFGHEIPLDDIQNQLKNDIPVLLGLDGKFFEKDKVTISFDSYFTPPMKVDNHSVVITGVERYMNYDCGRIATRLVVSTWGEKAYISYDELMAKKDKVLFCSLLDAICGENVSHVY